jgi:hypothetical protein
MWIIRVYVIVAQLGHQVLSEEAIQARYKIFGRLVWRGRLYYGFFLFFGHKLYLNYLPNLNLAYMWRSLFTGDSLTVPGHVLDDVPFIMDSTCWNSDVLIAKMPTVYRYPSIAVLLALFSRPLRSGRDVLSVHKSTTCTLDNIHWILRIHVMCLIRSILHCFPFICGPTSLIVMNVPSLYYIYLVFVD